MNTHTTQTTPVEATLEQHQLRRYRRFIETWAKRREEHRTLHISPLAETPRVLDEISDNNGEIHLTPETTHTTHP